MFIPRHQIFAIALPAATVAGGRKNTQIYIIKTGQKDVQQKMQYPRLVLGEEHCCLWISFK
jgi:hypothetical protein